MDIPFSKLMEQATALKTNQDAVDRKLYDSWAPWYQHSIFAKEVIVIFILHIIFLFFFINYI
jgi:hypothetical protein